jgi:hypothetical protein
MMVLMIEAVEGQVVKLDVEEAILIQFCNDFVLTLAFSVLPCRNPSSQIVLWLRSRQANSRQFLCLIIHFMYCTSRERCRRTTTLPVLAHFTESWCCITTPEGHGYISQRDGAVGDR